MKTIFAVLAVLALLLVYVDSAEAQGRGRRAGVGPRGPNRAIAGRAVNRGFVNRGFVQNRALVNRNFNSGFNRNFNRGFFPSRAFAFNSGFNRGFFPSRSFAAQRFFAPRLSFGLGLGAAALGYSNAAFGFSSFAPAFAPSFAVDAGCGCATAGFAPFSY